MNHDKSLLRKLHREMLRVRLVEERIADLYAEQEMRCPVHLSIGQEAAAVGVCAALEPTDYAFSGHRSHAHFLAKGGTLKGMIAEIYGKETGCSRGKGGSMHLVDLSVGFLGATPIVGSTIPIAVGAALASAMRGESRAAVSFLGDGAMEAGVAHESLNYAALHDLPVLFVCENNLYSVYSPLRVRQPADRTLSDLARGHGIESRHGDGNDVVGVYDMTRAALERVRAGKGPVFLELDTYRWREHCGPNYDNDIGYRTEREFIDWKERDPVRAFEDRLLKSAALSYEDLETVRAALKEEIDEAVAFAKASPFPATSELLEHVYST